MDEIEYQIERLRKKHQVPSDKKNKQKKSNKISETFTRILVAIIFVLGSAIYINLDKANYDWFKKTIFETNLSFTKISDWYQKHFGNVLPIDLKDTSLAVNKTTNDFTTVEKYLDGVKCHTTEGSIISTLNSGILVYMGEKENYGNVAIIQGIDGVDIWYGNIENINLSLYDYVEKNTLLGSAKESEIYLVIQKDGKFLNYEEYKSQI